MHGEGFSPAAPTGLPGRIDHHVSSQGEAETDSDATTALQKSSKNAKEAEIETEEVTEQCQLDEEEKQEPQPPDGGWGWMVAVGAFLVALVAPMLGPSFGVLFSPQMLEWRASSTTVAVISNGYMVMWKFTSSVSGTLTREFGFRKVAMTGMLLASAGLTLAASATSPATLFVCYSLGCGLGVGLATIGFLILARYFKKRRGLANTIQTTGVGLGRFLSPPLIQYLQVEYGSKGATMILGAVMLHGFLGTTLYQPVEWHMRRPENHKHMQHPHQVTLLPKHTEKTDTISDEKENTIHSDGGTTSLWRRVYNKVAGIVRAIIKDLSILRYPSALTLALGTALTISGHVNFIVMVSFAMQSTGHSLQVVAWCLFIAGLTNLLARICVSSLSDFSWFNMRIVFLSGIFTMAIAITAFPLQNSELWAGFTLGVFGCGQGVFHGLSNLYLAKVSGLGNLTPMFGARNLAVAIAFVTIGPLLGWVRDVSASYALYMWILSGLMSLSLALWILLPFTLTHCRPVPPSDVAPA